MRDILVGAIITVLIVILFLVLINRDPHGLERNLRDYYLEEVPK